MITLLAACGRQAEPTNQVAATPAARATATATIPDDHIDCALAGATTFQRVCSVELGDAGQLTLHNPDGGFHRATIARDGRGIIAADGAQPAVVAIVGDGVIAVTLGRDRYRLPATVRAAPR